MFRKLSVLSTLLAMMMVLFVSFVPHHHHHAIMCLAHEHCVTDEEDDASSREEQSDNHCICHADYCQSHDDFNPDIFLLTPTATTAPLPPVTGMYRLYRAGASGAVVFSPPILSWRINC